MRFVDWNGSGGLDPQDIATSVAMDRMDDEPDDVPGDGEPSHSHDRDSDDDAPGSGCPGCLSTVAMAVGVIFLIGVIIKLFI